MKVATKFVSPLDPDQVASLEALAEDDPVHRVRMRAHSILLSSRGICIEEIARIYSVHRDTVSSWLDRFAQSGVEGLRDKPRSGSPPKLDAHGKEVALALLKKHPNAPKVVLAQVTEQTGKSISRSTLKRLAKGAGLRWKRVRKSLKSQRDEEAFSQAKKEIDGLKKNSNPESLI
jgi:transposase